MSNGPSAKSSGWAPNALKHAGRGQLSVGAILTALLAAMLISASPVPANAVGTHHLSSAATLPKIEPQVMCVTCKIPLDTAESPQANRERAYITELIDEGRTEPQIKKALVAQYGPAVLSLPSTKGFDIVVYVVPAAVIIALLTLLAFMLPRWRRAARSASQSRGAPSLSPADAERLRRDMARFD